MLLVDFFCVIINNKSFLFCTVYGCFVSGAAGQAPDEGNWMNYKPALKH